MLGRSEDRRGQGGKWEGRRKLLHLSLAWLIAEVSVTFLHEKAGAEKADQHMFFFTFPFDPAVQEKKALYVQLLQQKKLWVL